jgi:hypothetical protein
MNEEQIVMLGGSLNIVAENSLSLLFLAHEKMQLIGLGVHSDIFFL